MNCCQQCDDIDKERIGQVEKAYAELKQRGWGFTSNGRGFGDPHATFTAVGPFDGFYVSVLAADHDCVVAVQKAIERFEAREKLEKHESKK